MKSITVLGIRNSPTSDLFRVPGYDRLYLCQEGLEELLGGFPGSMDEVNYVDLTISDESFVGATKYILDQHVGDIWRSEVDVNCVVKTTLSYQQINAMIDHKIIPSREEHDNDLDTVYIAIKVYSIEPS